jgi:SAM-dependent methyltransferase
MSALYDRIGTGYTATRRTDPRLAKAIWAALGDAKSVLDVGSGAAAYEPPDREVLAVEPSGVMIGQRPPGAAPVLQATAESLPLEDDSVDAAMAVFSDHHWSDRPRALRELRRVARQRVVLFNLVPTEHNRFWLTREYLPSVRRLVPAPYHRPGFWEEELAATLGPIELRPVPIPHNCRDGFYAAYWRRPEAYLDERVRDGTSVFARLPETELREGLDLLRADLRSGAWHAHHAELLAREEFDLGFRVVVADVSALPPRAGDSRQPVEALTTSRQAAGAKDQGGARR